MLLQQFHWTPAHPLAYLSVVEREWRRWERVCFYCHQHHQRWPHQHWNNHLVLYAHSATRQRHGPRVHHILTYSNSQPAPHSGPILDSTSPKSHDRRGRNQGSDYCLLHCLQCPSPTLTTTSVQSPDQHSPMHVPKENSELLGAFSKTKLTLTPSIRPHHQLAPCHHLVALYILCPLLNKWPWKNMSKRHYSRAQSIPTLLQPQVDSFL